MAKKKKYEPKHELVRKYVPKEFWELADSAYVRVGEVVAKLTLAELGGLYLGFRFAQHQKWDHEKKAISALTGLYAVRGLASRSEIVGTVSMLTLGAMGAVFMSKDLMKEAEEITTDVLAVTAEQRAELGIPNPPFWLATIQPCGAAPPISILALRAGVASLLWKPVCWSDKRWIEYKEWQDKRDELL